MTMTTQAVHDARIAANKAHAAAYEALITAQKAYDALAMAVYEANLPEGTYRAARNMEGHCSLARYTIGSV
jgi:hypothetical protein